MDMDKMLQLEGHVAEVDALGPVAQAEQAQQAEAAAQAITEGEAWAVIPRTVGSLVCMLAPELQPLYSDERCREWGDAMVPVAQKYGWGGPNVLPELGLIVATGTLAVPTYMVVKAKLAQLKAAAAKPEATPAHPFDGAVDATVVPSAPPEGMGPGAGDGG